MTSRKMNNTEESILRGLQEALDYSKGNLKAKKHTFSVPDINVHQARVNLGLSQEKFASTFGVSAATIRNWEQGRRKPTGAAKILLAVIQAEPDAVKRALNNITL